MSPHVHSEADAPIDVLEALLDGRSSCRAFLPDPVPRAHIDRILAVAQRTMSGCNSQPWQVEITSGEGTEHFREVMYAAASSGRPQVNDFPQPREYRGVHRARRRDCGFLLYNSLGIERGDRAKYAKQSLENYRFFGAPHVAIVHIDEALGVYGAVDCGSYLMNFLLAAQALGVATVPQAALTLYSDVVREHFGLSDDRRLVYGISFGYADRHHKANSFRTSRASIGEVARFHEHAARGHEQSAASVSCAD
ncbi:nitroreductase [Bradyrhizobium brasilense]|uniref:nitroreductase n=1 Tax=Bradyrhizobium brasilense TaxID=1419277 RepID=UPI001456C83E|nr:nitroreductase [Bradyrhizobium brasilense]NLS75306.1 nitroreductase [Bradyrhizobium brasilense]